MKIILAALVPLVASACAPLPDASAQPALLAVADPATVTGAAPSGPTVSYNHRPIGEPGNWRQLNDAQSGHKQ